ncbi:uncharacterized protein LOC127881024 [Dreissena polymorpha]|uniref:uncharacterized protein LOC127881024 n=1 Tax=Dreissena polymorpha TaxID=45954 RepID=UPI0022643AB9|nr:uncharacterized protein LOC127881024 [Dreissena polymorpha]XP_052284564.1 uncharacterized protein LOC127881024 [Dreissena polymorpha]
MAGPTYNYGAPSSVNLFPGASLVNHGELSITYACADAARNETLVNTIRDELHSFGKDLLTEVQVRQRNEDKQSGPTSSKKDKDCEGTEIISTLLRTSSKGMDYEDLDREVKLVLSEQQPCFKSFQEFTNLSLYDFLMYKSDTFELKRLPKGCRRVKLRNKGMAKHTLHKAESGILTSKCTNMDLGLRMDSSTIIKEKSADRKEHNDQGIQVLTNPTTSAQTHETRNAPNESIVTNVKDVTQNKQVLTNPTTSALTNETQNDSIVMSVKDVTQKEQIKIDIPVCDVKNSDYEHQDNGEKNIPEVEEFLKDVNNFSRGSFVLMAGDIPYTIDLDSIGLVPWVAVLDFDPLSKEKGLLNIVQPVISSNRSLKVTQLGEIVDNLAETATRWFLFSDKQDSILSKSLGEETVTVDANGWFRKHKEWIKDPLRKIEKFANDLRTITVILLWPQNIELGKRMIRVLNSLNDELGSTPRLMVCIQSDALEEVPVSFDYLKEIFQTNLKTYKLDMRYLCSALQRTLIGTTPKDSFRLPNGKDTDECNISPMDAAWLSEDLDVLYMNKPFKNETTKDDQVIAHIEEFYKGGTLECPFWYYELVREAVVQRDIQKDIEGKLKQRLNKTTKPSHLTLYHAPGSGGSTMARSILWNLHSEFICVKIKLNPAFAQKEFEKRIEFLHAKSDLPVLLLVDAEVKMSSLIKRLPNTVIFFVQRLLYDETPIDDTDIVFLAGKITPKEAQVLCLKLEPNCRNEKQRRRLRQLREKVKTGHKRLLYEFGMTVYQHEFKGIVSFVKGHLRLGQDNVLSLLPEQICVGFLALTDYYGHTSVPCHFFAELLGQRCECIQGMEDLPAIIRELVVEDETTRKDNVRIRHWLVSKEILEQILSRQLPVAHHTVRSSDLSSPACQQLMTLARDFVVYSSQQNNLRSSCLRSILVKTFIIREKLCRTENGKRKKSIVSRLLTDIPGDPPLFTERCMILQLLVEKFDRNPSFHAHLGRFYAYCRNEYEQSEICFRKALEICDELTNCTETQVEDIIRLEIMHIYHMYATYQSRSLKKDLKTMTVEQVIGCASEACKYFEKSRNIAPKSHILETFHYTDEVKVRLLACEVVQQMQVNNLDFRKVNMDKEVNFLAYCVEIIPLLIRKCAHGEMLQPDVVSILTSQEQKYNTIFGDHQIDLIQRLSQLGSISKRRLQILSKSRSTMGANKQDIIEIVHLYEDNFREMSIRRNKISYADKDQINFDFLEWLNAIRSEVFEFTLEEVLLKVKLWKQLTASNISRFYIFVCYSLLGFGTDTGLVRSDCIDKAFVERSEILKNNDQGGMNVYRCEWLVETGHGIKRLTPDFSFNPREFFSLPGRNHERSLYVCTGKIASPNSNKWFGKILLNLDINKNVSARFVPHVNDLEGRKFEGQSVEFNLLFTMKNGYEAHNVKLMSSHQCFKCRRSLEFTSKQDGAHCPCGNYVDKNELNWSGGRWVY